MRTATRIAAKVVRIAIIAVALAAATVLVVPRLLGWRTVTVMSGSMAPAYRVDAVLAVAPVDPNDVHEGDVIAFETESDRPLITHRVVAVEHDVTGLRFLTKGDANEDADLDPVAATAVRGRVVFGVPSLGLFVRAVNDRIGFALLVLLPGVLLIAQELAEVRRDARQAKSTDPTWAPPAASDKVADADAFDFWTTPADEDRYYDELCKEVPA